MTWFGLLAAGLAWAAQLVIGFGVTEVACGPSQPVLGVDVDAWQISLMATAGVITILAEAAALSVLLETRGLDHEDPPPWGRRRFFVEAAVLGNALFFVAILLSGLGVIYLEGCIPA